MIIKRLQKIAQGLVEADDVSPSMTPLTKGLKNRFMNQEIDQDQ